MSQKSVSATVIAGLGIGICLGLLACENRASDAAPVTTSAASAAGVVDKKWRDGLPDAPTSFAVYEKIRVDASNIVGIQLKQEVRVDDTTTEIQLPGFVMASVEHPFPPCYVQPSGPGALVMAGGATDYASRFLMVEANSGRLVTNTTDMKDGDDCPSGVTFIIESASLGAKESSRYAPEIKAEALVAAKKILTGQVSP